MSATAKVCGPHSSLQILWILHSSKVCTLHYNSSKYRCSSHIPYFSDWITFQNNHDTWKIQSTLNLEVSFGCFQEVKSSVLHLQPFLGPRHKELIIAWQEASYVRIWMLKDEDTCIWLERKWNTLALVSIFVNFSRGTWCTVEVPETPKPSEEELQECLILPSIAASWTQSSWFGEGFALWTDHGEIIPSLLIVVLCWAQRVTYHCP